MEPVSVKKYHSLVFVGVFFSGLLLFVGLRQLPSPWKYLSLAGLLLSAAIVIHEVKIYSDIARLFGLYKTTTNGYYYLAISMLLGLLWSISFRGYLDLSLMPDSVTLFAITATLVGVTEEIIFRGYIQQELRKTGILASVIVTSALHTFYKCFIFWVLPPVYETDYLYFSLLTFSMGCLLGLLKEYGRSTWVPVSGHALFDLLSYGDKMINAWWIWM